jgi:hypothetical protein
MKRLYKEWPRCECGHSERSHSLGIVDSGVRLQQICRVALCPCKRFAAAPLGAGKEGEK